MNRPVIVSTNQHPRRSGFATIGLWLGLWKGLCRRSLWLFPLFNLAGALVCKRIRLARGPSRCSHPHCMPRAGGSVSGFILLRAQAFKWVHALLPAMHTKPLISILPHSNSHLLKVLQHVVQSHARQK